LEPDDRIGIKVVEVYLLARLLNFLGLLDIKPAHVSEEETSECVVGIGWSLRMLVVNPVVTGPMENGSLIGDRVG